MIKQHKNYTISTFTVTSIHYVPKFLTWGKLTGNTVQIHQIINAFAVATSKYIGYGESITAHSLCAATAFPAPDNCFLDTNLRDIAPNTIRLHVGEDISNVWWRHQMETFSALLAICAGNSPVPGKFPTQRPVTRSFDVYFDLRPNKRLSKHLWGW